MSKDNFKDYSNFYDQLNSHKNYQKESRFISKLIKNHNLKKNINILEFGTGTGRHAHCLVKEGYRVHGIEKSSGMIKKLKLIKGFTCQRGDVTKVKLKKKFDAVLSLFHVVSYQDTNKKVKAIFANASYHLNKNGIFIFDVWYSPAVFFLKPTIKKKEVKKNDIYIKRIAYPTIKSEKNLVDVNYSFFYKNLKTNSTKTFKEKHPMRHFSLLEIDLLAEMNGFKRVKSIELLTNKKPSENTWGITIVLKKINE